MSCFDERCFEETENEYEEKKQVRDKDSWLTKLYLIDVFKTTFFLSTKFLYSIFLLKHNHILLVLLKTALMTLKSLSISSAFNVSIVSFSMIIWCPLKTL